MVEGFRWSVTEASLRPEEDISFFLPVLLSSLCYTATSSNLQAILHMIMYRLFILLVRLQGEHYALSS